MKIDSTTVHGRRRIYVSWFISDDQRLEWKKEFWGRVRLTTGMRKRKFAPADETRPLEPGVLRREWLQQQLESGEGRDAVTDFVAVLTTEYLTQQLDDEGELARAIAWILAHDRHDRVRVYLAAVDSPQWDDWEVAEVPFRDAGARLRWLVKLREDRFVWPETSRAQCEQQVAEAVELITGEVGEEDAR